MTTSSTVEESQVDLSRRTRDELQPACELPRNNEPCPDPAAWILWVTGLTIDGTPKILACEHHRRRAIAHRVECWICRTFARLHCEPLR